MWNYKNKTINSIEELPNSEALHGFVYGITNLSNNKFYIGKKNFYSVRKKTLTKKEISTDKRLKKYKHVSKESNWKEYNGSNKALQEDITVLGVHMFQKEIIALAYTSKQLTYLEMEAQVNHDVLRSENCYNDNIMARFFRKDLIINK